MLTINLFEQETKDYNLIDCFEAFLPIAIKELGLTRLPKIHIKKDVNMIHVASFGGYDDIDKKITLVINNRQPADIIRTLAHELVHFKQGENNELKPGDWKDGSDPENEANAEAGVLMRKLAHDYPGILSAKPVQLP
jgi:Zn-dependent peptidase ImmA (M78 family)|tara:strand:+ start:60 stop:470 length:411 start_codon:yes stop_codon:yes gene_type:complete